MDDAATRMPADDIDFHRRREAQECELAHSAPTALLRDLHFRMAEHHAHIVMQTTHHRSDLSGGARPHN